MHKLSLLLIDIYETGKECGKLQFKPIFCLTPRPTNELDFLF